MFDVKEYYTFHTDAMAKLIPFGPAISGEDLVDLLKKNTLESCIVNAKKPITVVFGGTNYTLAPGRHYLPFFYIFNGFQIPAHELSNVSVEQVTLDRLVETGLINTIVDNKIVARHLNNLRPIVISSLSSQKTQNFIVSLDGLIGEIDQKPHTSNFFRPFQHQYLETVETDRCRCYLYAPMETLTALRTDPAVTSLLDCYDKELIRLSNPPCIAIRYNINHFKELQEALSKYEVTLPQTKCISKDIFRDSTQEEMDAQSKEHQDIINQYLDAGILTVTKYIQFRYKHLLSPSFFALIGLILLSPTGH